MPVPTYDKCMLPLLQFASDGQEHHIREAIEALANYFSLTEADRAEKIPSGKKYKFDDRVQWANTYLKKAGLLRSVRRGVFAITDRGLDVLRSNPPHIDAEYLAQFPEFLEFASPSTDSGIDQVVAVSEFSSQQTPQEILQASYATLREQLAQELLDAILSCPPSFFETLVVDLLVALGYGGAIENAGEVLGKTGDNGIDGIIKEDKLGFDAIYVQAKRWNREQVVGRPVVQAFAGSLMGQGGSKGVFITTSSFSRDAMAYASKVPQLKIVLIDSEQLARLMMDNNIGVTPIETYTVKRVDADYFQFE